MKIKAVEPWIFLFFGAFHLHRVWGLVDRPSYAAFWLGIMTQRGPLYFLFMGLLAALCVIGVVIFLTNLRDNPWWRWVYPLCGGYLLFDLAAIASGWNVWNALIIRMYDTTTPYWNLVWGAFIVLGGASWLLGMFLWRQRKRQRSAHWQG